MEFNAIGESTKYARGVGGAPGLITDIYTRNESGDISKGFNISTYLTREHALDTEGEYHYATEIRRVSNPSFPRIGVVHAPKGRNLLEQLSCCLKIHYNAKLEFFQGKIPSLHQGLVEEFFSDSENLPIYL